jgi:lipooligosaccharide transport system permease protein
MATTIAPRIVPFHLWGGRRAARLIERNAMVYRHAWTIIVSGVFEPLFYLFSIGVGIGNLVDVHLRAPNGSLVSYTAYVAPALLASSAMNGAIFDATFNIFFKLKYAKTYDAILATPVDVGDIAVGEIAWALLRGAMYAAAFLVVMAVMGLVHSWWALLALPAATLIGFCFAACGMAGTSYMRSWQDFSYVSLVQQPLFLFSATFFPLSTYPTWLGDIIRWTPLYQGVVLMRALILGGVDISSLGHVLYLLTLGLIGSLIAARRLGHLLLK